MQRMCSLLWYLNERKNTKAFLVSERIGNSFPSLLKKYSKTNFDFLPDIIIRDMRDSSEDEIVRLKKIAPIIVIDDNGKGRKSADYAIDILPNPETENKEFNNKIFLYGYNFLTALRELKNKNIKKELDFAVYPGISANSEFIEFLTSLLPEKSSYAVLSGKNSYVIKNTKKKYLEESLYSEIILSSKTIISHFGIILYEGLIAGCKIISINPSQYHSRLADMAGDYLHILNLGESANLNTAEAKISIKKTVQAPLCSEVNAAEVFQKIIDGLENFSKLLFDIIDTK
jgi:hypothetical protein